MKINMPSPSIIKLKIRWFLRSPSTWIAVAITTLTVFGQQYGVEYLQYPFVILIVATIPAVGGLAIGPKFALVYFRSHMAINIRLPWNKGKKFYYGFCPEYAETKLGLLTPTFFTMLNLFGLLFVAVSALQIADPKFTDPNYRLTALALFLFPCIILSSGFNVSAWIHKATGCMFENKLEGDRTNLGKNLRANLGKVIGLGSAISFGTMFLDSPSGIVSGVAIVLVVMTFSLPSVLFSFYIMRSKYLEKMKMDFVSKASKYLSGQ